MTAPIPTGPAEAPRPRVVDCHQHACWRGRDGEGLVRDLDEQGIAYAWLLTWNLGPEEDDPVHHEFLNPARHRADDTHPGIALPDLIAARDRHPARFVLGYCPHPSWRRAPRLLESAHAMHGARVCGEWKYRQLFDDPRSLEIFRVAGELKMPVLLHLDVPYRRGPAGRPEYQPSWFGGTVANLERALQACPQTVFIGHAPGFWREIGGGADEDPAEYPSGPVAPGGRLERLFADYPNLYADLSANSGRIALERDPEHALAFLTRHADRLLFGRDIYGGRLAAFLATLPLAAAEREKIAWRNAERLVPPPAEAL
jgi:predicted TIM-barrel fold metal-dependent hydrolase